MKAAQVLVFAAVLSSAAAAFAAQKTLPAQAWLARLPPPPATAEAAYAQWTDTSGTLKPAPQIEKIREGIKSEVLVLSRASQPPTGAAGPLSRHDQVLAGRISAFPDTARVLQNIQAARTAQSGLIQKWNADLHTLEQRRLHDRSALPACHNEAGVPAPSQLAIRDVELAYVREKISIAAQYLEQFKPVFQQMLAAVSPRMEHGDTVMDAWEGLRSPGAQAQFARIAHASESDALLDVVLLQEFIQGVSKLAARPIADRNALGRVYAHAKGC
jgi:hypothetical protein